MLRKPSSSVRFGSSPCERSNHLRAVQNKSLGDITDNALETEAMLKRTMSDVLKSIGQHAAIDAGKLGLDTLAHGIVAKATYDPEKSPASILEESLQSALTGALMGGVIRAVHEFAIRKSGGKAAGEKPTDTEPQSPNPDVPPNLPGGLPVEVKTAASDAELKANPNGGDLKRQLSFATSRRAQMWPQ